MRCRISQARASANALLVTYSSQPAGKVSHRLAPQDMSDALWGLVELLEQAATASNALNGLEVKP